LESEMKIRRSHEFLAEMKIVEKKLEMKVEI
jgi:hypothetical protein